MAFQDIDNSNLLKLIALVFPDGSPADLGRRISHEYESSFNEGSIEGKYRRADQLQIIGQMRWANNNRMLGEFAESVGWPVNDVRMGEGHDNHVEITAKCFRITCHHVARGQSKPSNAKYLVNSYKMNGLLSQGDLFQENIDIYSHSVENLINLQILHTTNPENPRQVEDIDFVFANSQGTLAKFSISDLISCQAELQALPIEEMKMIKKQFKKFGLDDSI